MSDTYIKSVSNDMDCEGDQFIMDIIPSNSQPKLYGSCLGGIMLNNTVLTIETYSNDTLSLRIDYSEYSNGVAVTFAMLYNVYDIQYYQIVNECRCLGPDWILSKNIYPYSCIDTTCTATNIIDYDTNCILPGNTCSNYQFSYGNACDHTTVSSETCNAISASDKFLYTEDCSIYPKGCTYDDYGSSRYFTFSNCTSSAFAC